MKTVWKYVLIVLGIILLIALIIWGNSTPPSIELTSDEQVKIEALRKQAYDYALTCGGKTENALSFNQITWVIVPGSVINLNTTDGTAHLKGYFSPKDSAIYIPYTERETFWIAAHESLHALGWIGHPNKPFKYPCQVTAEQNP